MSGGNVYYAEQTINQALDFIGIAFAAEFQVTADVSHDPLLPFVSSDFKAIHNAARLINYDLGIIDTRDSLTAVPASTLSELQRHLHEASRSFRSRRRVAVALKPGPVADGRRSRAHLRRARADGRAVASAVSRLAVTERSRWKEEWEADLASIPGAFAAWRWRWGLRINARRMRRAIVAPARLGGER